MDRGCDHAQAPRVDAIETKNWQHGRKGARRTTMRGFEDLRQVELLLQRPVGPAPPIVEIAGDDKRRPWGNRFLDALAQRMHLPTPPALEETEMDVDAMQRREPAPHLQHAMQQSPALEGVRGDVEVFLGDDRE